MMSLSANIKQFAIDAGFDRVSIVPAVRLDDEAERLSEWLDAGYHASMDWIAREPQRRADPREIFPAARSVVVVLKNYYTDHRHTSPGKISRYAWGDDYHDVVGSGLRTMLERIRLEVPEIEGKVCVDTAPMMDKAWAVRAGLGWIGKHSNVITRDLGSWVFIGELILDLELEYDSGLVEDHCGTCTACLDACPTSAIVEPYIVDSVKCISYATIEYRGDQIPPEVSSHLDGWLYGCDICQDVCPWNRFEKPTSDVRFEPRLGQTSVEPNGILEMEHPEYVERFRRSPIKRAKLNGLKRNAKHLMK
ncbi:MAG: tRNA epoxyqueuosine(34) reductase QueG [Pyrinomonadaceae bacterium]|nr:tRNA epoxyqueuosine(34) reductase QueG [Pyrinomonadaceae bacterium]